VDLKWRVAAVVGTTVNLSRCLTANYCK